MTKDKQALARAEALMAELFAGDRSPMEEFGTSWEKLEALEEAIPEIDNLNPYPYFDSKLAAAG